MLVHALHAKTAGSCCSRTPMCAGMCMMCAGMCAQCFTQPEKLDASETWFCTKCKSHVQAEKKLDLWSLPELLVVHLKRFRYSDRTREKLDALVEIPLQDFDLSKYLLREQVRSKALCR